MGKREQAVLVFAKGYNCSQSVFSVYCEKYGLDPKMAQATATGFGAGIAQTQTICGAVTGAIMVIGLKLFDHEQIKDSKQLVYEKTRLFLNTFQAKHGTTECLRLIGANLRSAEGMAFIREHNLFELKCQQYVADACDILDQIFAEDQNTIQAG